MLILFVVMWGGGGGDKRTGTPVVCFARDIRSKECEARTDVNCEPVWPSGKALGW